jgi:hypothetical protein
MNTQKQVIGNQGGFVHTRSFGEVPAGKFPFAGIDVPGSSNYPAPFYPGVGSPSLLPGGTGGSGSSLFNIGQIMQFINRMGGIEGIMNTMAKVQQIVSNIQQMAPMLKLLMKSFGKANSPDAEDDVTAIPRHRRRRRRKTVRKKKKGMRLKIK